jgi:hypothetical protein
MKRAVVRILVAVLVTGGLLFAANSARQSAIKASDARRRDRMLEQAHFLATGDDDSLFLADDDYLNELVADPRAAENLKSINVSSGLRDESDDWTPLRKLPNLKDFHLYCSDQGTDKFLATLESMESIERVGLEQTKISAAGLASLKNYPGLKHLSLCHYLNPPLDLKALEGHPALTSIFIRDLPVTKASVEALATMPNLNDVHWESESMSENRPLFESLTEFDVQFVGNHTVKLTRKGESEN